MAGTANFNNISHLHLKDRGAIIAPDLVGEAGAHLILHSPDPLLFPDLDLNWIAHDRC